MKIDIEMDNPRDFTQVAYVFDWDKFLSYTSVLQNVWLNNNLVPYENFDSWLKGYHPELNYTKETASQLEEVAERYHLDKLNKRIDLVEESKRDMELSDLNVFDYEIESLVRKLGLTPTWKKLIMKAVISGKVTDIDWNEYRSSKEQFLYNPWLYDTETYKFIKPRQYKGATKSSVKLHRDWYFLNNKSDKSKLGLRKLSAHYNAPISTISDAINDYKKFLNNN